MLETERLVLREWRPDDADSMFSIGQDPGVMRWLGPLMDRNDAQRLVDGQILNQSLFGHCFWPVERRSDRAVLGFCGLNPLPAGTPLEGKIEIGWRLARYPWGHGYAREAAEASLAWGFAHLSDPAIWATTVLANTRSWGLMERLGMTRQPHLDFDWPDYAVEDPLCPHIVYRADGPR